MRIVLLFSLCFCFPSVTVSAVEGEVQLHDGSAQIIYARGRIEPVDRVKELGFERLGRIREILVAEGQRVESGAEIARLDDAAEIASVQVRRAEVALAKARLAELENRITPEEFARARALVDSAAAREDVSATDATRAENLHEDGVISRQEMDRAVSTSREEEARRRAYTAELERLYNFVTPEMLAVAREEIAVAEATVQRAEADLGKTVLYAPSGGTVLRLNLSTGDLFVPEAGTPVCLFADLGQVRVRAQLDELQISRLSAGQTAEIRGRGLGDEVLHGRVSTLLPVMGERRMYNRFPEERLDLDVQEVFIELLSPCSAPVGLEVDVNIRVSPDQEAAASAK